MLVLRYRRKDSLADEDRYWGIVDGRDELVTLNEYNYENYIVETDSQEEILAGIGKLAFGDTGVPYPGEWQMVEFKEYVDVREKGYVAFNITALSTDYTVLRFTR